MANLEQKDRHSGVNSLLLTKATSVLIATDVASRGLDVKEVTAVISYQITALTLK